MNTYGPIFIRFPLIILKVVSNGGSAPKPPGFNAFVSKGAIERRRPKATPPRKPDTALGSRPRVALSSVSVKQHQFTMCLSLLARWISHFVLDIGYTLKTNSIKTDFNQTDSSIHQPDGCDGWSGGQSEKQSPPDLSDIERLKEEMSGQVYLHSFLDERDQDGQQTYKPGLVRAVFLVIIELLIHTGDSIFIDGGSVNTEYVKNQVRALRPADFEYVLKGLQNNTNPVRNMKAYIRTAVYRAVSMSDAHYDYDENNGYRSDVLPEVDVDAILEYGRRMKEKFDRLRAGQEPETG